MRFRRRKKYFSLSLLMHLAIALYLIFTFPFSNTINEKQIQALPIYIYSMANTTQDNNKPPIQDMQKTPAEENNKSTTQNISQSTVQETNKPIIQDSNKSAMQEDDKSTIQNNNEPVIQYDSRLVAQDKTNPEQSNPIEWITSPKKSNTDKDEEDNLINQQEIQSNNNAAKLDQQILQILHESITNKQYYPEEAMAAQQKGIVKIKFLLFPDGHLEKISISASSGISSLDLAAIQIVESISPDKKAGALLQRAKFFYVDIIFEQ